MAIKRSLSEKQTSNTTTKAKYKLQYRAKSANKHETNEHDHYNDTSSEDECSESDKNFAKNEKKTRARSKIS